VRFIEQHRDRPFFLYLRTTALRLWADCCAIRPAIDTRTTTRTKNCSASHGTPRIRGCFNNREFLNNMVAIRRVAAETGGVDDGVGEILSALKRLGLEDNTLVVYAADQGWMGGHNGLWAWVTTTRPPGAWSR